MVKEPRKILVALDRADTSTRTLRYVMDMMGGQADLSVRLLHVIAPIPAELREHGGSEDPQEEERLSRELRRDQTRWIEQQRRESLRVLEEFRDQLAAHGFPPSAISLDTMACQGDDAVDYCILEAAGEWGAGTVVVGWDAFSWFDELGKTHIAERLIHRSQQLTIWVVKP